MDFKWHPDEPPPQIEPHSKAKLRVLRQYLRAYFDRLNVSPKREVFKLDLIDGFAGGGTFLDNGTPISGTPLVMLEEAADANKRLNRNRKPDKQLVIDCKFYFIDKQKAHTDHLKKVLREQEYGVDGERIVVQTERFKNELDGILKSVSQRQPRAGRAIFLLDQTGFSQVDLTLVRSILKKLPAAEVILTFAAEALINFLTERPQLVKAVAPLQLTKPQIHNLLQDKDERGGRALAQRTLRTHVRTITEATYDTPFFIRPEQSRRALWFLHLSRHPTARDVMIQQHWKIQNTFEHYGPGGFDMLGWDTLRDSDIPPLFQFGELDRRQMKNQLLETLPNELAGMVWEQPVTIDAIRHAFANRTTARSQDLDQTVLKLALEGEFHILDPEGKRRSRALKQLRATDQVALPSTLLLPGLGRVR